jgi:hypothetical protein
LILKNMPLAVFLVLAELEIQELARVQVGNFFPKWNICLYSRFSYLKLLVSFIFNFKILKKIHNQSTTTFLYQC